MEAVPPPAPQAAAALHVDINPPPANWDQVPRVDHKRLNAVLAEWVRRYDGIYSVEIQITPDRYVWQLFLQPSMHVTAEQMQTIQRACANVILIECRSDVTGHNGCIGAVCIYVASSAYDQRTLTTVHTTKAVDGAASSSSSSSSSYTQRLLDAEENAMLEVMAAAQAAAGD
jgi:hypothetical protein